MGKTLILESILLMLFLFNNNTFLSYSLYCNTFLPSIIIYCLICFYICNISLFYVFLICNINVMLYVFVIYDFYFFLLLFLSTLSLCLSHEIYYINKLDLSWYIRQRRLYSDFSLVSVRQIRVYSLKSVSWVSLTVLNFVVERSHI